MKAGFRQSQAWLHTWTGVILGWLLFAIFITGTVSYFQDEITHWMHPERHGSSSQPLHLDRITASLAEQAGNASAWQIVLPTERMPVVTAYWRAEGTRRFEQAIFDPASGQALQTRPSEGGNFFYRFHFQLWHIDVLTGRYLIGIATMFMFVALITGIITHKKIFKDFFTFRPRKGQRSWLDGHNVTAVLALPFHLMITFTGLVIFTWLYMPWGVNALYGDDRMAFFDELFPRQEVAPRTGDAFAVPPLQPFLDRARERWQGEPPARITIHNPGDRNALIEIATGQDNQIAGNEPHLVFQAQDGTLIRSFGSLKPVALFSRVLVNLHLGQFADPILRWLYFLSGLGGTVMVASGLVLWVVKRTVQAGEKPGLGLRLVRVLNVGAVPGLIVAMASYFWANRLLPGTLEHRAECEIHVFFAVWAAAFIHSAIRPHRRAWVEQLACAALLLSAIPILDVVTHSYHLPRNASYSEWMVTGFDITCAALGGLLFWAAWKVSRHAATVQPKRTTRASADADAPLQLGPSQ
ncbi:PepSY-associated TM helix domain-containing protein [Pseudomonas sp. Marseille-QA0892]